LVAVRDLIDTRKKEGKGQKKIQISRIRNRFN